LGCTPLVNLGIQPSVEQLLWQVDCCAAPVWGSNAEQRAHQQNAFATSDSYGQPAIFVTTTPKMDNSISVAYYAGGIEVNSLVDVDFRKHMMSQTECKRLSLAPR
jgi:hypothetical protein